MPPKLSLAELRARSRARNGTRTQAFDVILNSCHNRIRRASESGQTSCVFEIHPLWFLVHGMPLVSTADCVSHVRHNLERAGLFVEVMSANKIFVSWDEEVAGGSGGAGPSGAGGGVGGGGRGARITLPFS